MPTSLEMLLGIAGVILLASGIMGGGLRVIQIDVPQLGRYARIISALAGVSLVAVALTAHWIGPGRKDPHVQSVSAAPAAPQASALPGNSPPAPPPAPAPQPAPAPATPTPVATPAPSPTPSPRALPTTRTQEVWVSDESGQVEIARALGLADDGIVLMIQFLKDDQWLSDLRPEYFTGIYLLDEDGGRVDLIDVTGPAADDQEEGVDEVYGWYRFGPLPAGARYVTLVYGDTSIYFDLGVAAPLS